MRLQSYIIKVLNLITIERIKNIAYLLFITSTILIVYNLFNPTAIGIFFSMNILALSLGMIIYSKVNNKNSNAYYNSKIFILTVIFFVLFLIVSTLFSLFSINYRNIFYFILITISFSIIMFQILFFEINKKNSIIIIFEIIILVITNNISIYFINNKDLAFWDSFFHYSVIKEVFLTNTLPSPNENWGAFGLFHIFNTIVLKVLFNNLNINYIYIDILFVIPFIIFSYYLLYKITKNIKAGLFSSLLISLIILTPHFTPHFLSFMLYLFTIYLFYNFIFSKSIKKFFIIMIIASFSSFLYHPTSGLFLSLIFISANFILFITKNKNTAFSYVYLVITISYLIYVTGPLFEFLVRKLTLPTVTYGYYEYLAGGKKFTDYLVYYIFSHSYYPIIIFFGGIGLSYLIISNKSFKNYFLPLIASITFLFPFMLLVTYRAAEQYIGTILILFSVALIAGASMILNDFLKKKIKTLFIVFCALAFFIVVLNTDDNPYFNKYSNPFSDAYFFTDSMYKAREFFELMPRNINFTLDLNTANVIINKYFFLEKEKWLAGEKIYEINDEWKGIVGISKYGIKRNGGIILEEEEIKEMIKRFINEYNSNIIFSSDNVLILYKYI